METLSPIEILREEHRECLDKLSKLDSAIERFKESKDVKKLREEFKEFHLFMITEHKSHVREEENALFPVLLKNSELKDIDVKDLVGEHHKEKDALKGITELFLFIKDDSSHPKILEAINLMQSLTSDLRTHMGEEEKMLYTEAEEKLSRKELKDIKEKILKIKKF